MIDDDHGISATITEVSWASHVWILIFMMQKFSHSELILRQQGQTQAHLPFSVILNNIRSLYNVGSIFRTADGAGIEKIWLCGITGFPPAGGISKTALGAEHSVPWEYKKDAREVIRDLKMQGYQIVMLEQARQSIPYQEFDPQTPVCLVLGNEIEGVEEGLLPDCDAAIEIEMSGATKNSLNVGVAFGIVAYEMRNKLIRRNNQDTRSKKQTITKFSKIQDAIH